MKKSLVASGVVISLCLLALTGCASKPTTADLMRQHGAELKSQVDLKKQLAKDWDNGTKLVATGEKRVKKGEKQLKSAERDLKKAQDEIKRGTSEIAEGQKLISESNKIFRVNFPELDINSGK
jgi:peptidoglycan hydrolase CwlO-like protein